jgi:hypothetical protein
MSNFNENNLEESLVDHQTKMKLLNIQFIEHYKLLQAMIQARADEFRYYCSDEYYNSQEYLDDQRDDAEERDIQRRKDMRYDSD